MAPPTPLAPGAKVAVTVRSAHRRATVSLLSADWRGTPTRTLARRTLRSGTFTATLPATPGAIYQLRAVIAGKRYFSWITTPPPLPAKPPPSAPTGMDAWMEHCPGKGTPELLQLATDTVHPGDTVSYTLTSPGGSCMSGGVCSSLQRQAEDRTWTPVVAGSCPAVGVFGYDPPGTSRTESFVVPADAPPGAYRYLYRMGYLLPDGTGGRPSATFTVTA